MLTHSRKFVHLFLSITELFQRSVGDTTDVVQKEMYTFNTKGEDSITLRPEGTAGSARAILEHGVYNDGYPTRLTISHLATVTKSRKRADFVNFTSLVWKLYGAASYFADAEVICAADSIFKRLGVKGLNLEINSIGCPKCRANYHKALKEYFAGHTSELCETWPFPT